MPIDPQIQTVLDQMEEIGFPGLSSLPVEQARAALAMMGAAEADAVEEVARVEDLEIPGPGGAIPARAYVPATDGTPPVVVYYHGGGLVLGGLDSHDGTCRALANASGALVLSIDYRLAPEHPFPAAVEDAGAALDWVAANVAELGGDPARLAVAGDSAGGNLAAVVALQARDAGAPQLRGQLLVYPVTDSTMSHPSIEENASGYFLTKADMEWFFDHYAPERPDDWRLSPLAAPDLAGLPPALVLTAEFDPLRDEGEAYARRLADAGVPVELVRKDGLIHGFFGMVADVDEARDAMDRAGAALRAWLA
ncbi:MAG: alpha/beta hydrolase [Actinomycetota bacterium]|nr:alpha/beta hydrolase [Actinomycetota bacterium]